MIRSILLAVSVIGAAVASAAATEIHCAGNEKNRDTYLKMDDVLFDQRDADRVLEFYAPEFISHNTDEGGAGQAVRTAESMKPMWISSKKNQPDRKLNNELILCAGDLVVVRVTMTATQTGPLYGMPATGKAYKTTSTDIFRFKDGKVVERWGNNDGIGMLSQLGLLLPFAQAQAAKAAEKK